MKVEYKTANGRLSVGIEGEKPQDVFENLAKFQEVFEESACGKCGCDNLRFIVREIDDNKFYELQCTNNSCRAKLTFGKNKDGSGMYPKRCKVHTTGKNKGKAVKDENGKTEWLPNNGWQTMREIMNDDTTESTKKTSKQEKDDSPPF